MSTRLLTARLNRRRLIQVGAAAGAVGLGTTCLRSLALAATTPTDAQLLARLVVLEDQAVYIYGQLAGKLGPAATATAGGPLDPLLAVVRFGGLHLDHRNVLAQALKGAGGTQVPVDNAYPQLLPAVSDPAAVLAALSSVEATLLGAFNGAQPAFTSATLGAQVASIYPVTARFQALLLAAQRQPPVPAAFVTGDPRAAAAIVVTLGSATASSSST